MDKLKPSVSRSRMSEAQFNDLSSIVYQHCGIKLGGDIKTRIEIRLNKRLRTLQLGSFKDYIEYLKTSDNMGQEMILMTDVITTHKTDFFRENHHFIFLRMLLDQKAFASGSNFNISSAGCSAGEEPYTLAMVLQEYRARKTWLSIIRSLPVIFQR